MTGLAIQNAKSQNETTSTEAMPVLFLGHGSPMNAITPGPFTQFLQRKGGELPRPRAILSISAHWETRGTKILKRPRPETIHDFYGFPEELYKIQYPAPGSEATADQVAALLKAHEAETNSEWGLDHGTWALLMHLYPQADIPVLQLSLNRNMPLREHWEMAKNLRSLREQGVLILGSGNIVHNLRMVDWSASPKPMDWAQEFDQLIAKALQERNMSELLAENPKVHSLWNRAVPSAEHYLPLLYTLGASFDHEVARFPYEEIQMGSLSMRAVEFSGS